MEEEGGSQIYSHFHVSMLKELRLHTKTSKCKVKTCVLITNKGEAPGEWNRLVRPVAPALGARLARQVASKVPEVVARKLGLILYKGFRVTAALQVPGAGIKVVWKLIPWTAWNKKKPILEALHSPSLEPDVLNFYFHFVPQTHRLRLTVGKLPSPRC